MSSQEMIHAYRHLYRNLLRAVQYSKPARFTARDRLREAFRPSSGGGGAAAAAAASPFDAEAIRRTIWFLKAAAAERGLEHRILRNLLRTAHARAEAARRARNPWRQCYRVQMEKKATTAVWVTSSHIP